MTPVSQRSIWEQVADRVGGSPQGMSRADIAREFSIHKTTAQSHLEKGVQRGLLIKVYTWVSKTSRGWVYYPATGSTPPDHFFHYVTPESQE